MISRADILREYERRRAVELLGDRSESPAELWMIREALDDYVDACVQRAAERRYSTAKAKTLVERGGRKIVLLPWAMVAKTRKVVRERDGCPLDSPVAAIHLMEVCADFVSGDPPMDAEFLEPNVGALVDTLWKIRYATNRVQGKPCGGIQ